jgi:glycylpeptide N-tetradecanoyltransferase
VTVINSEIEAAKPLEEVQKEPYSLGPTFEWCTVDVDDGPQLQEVYDLLYQNYVEDDDNMFRFDYSKEFLLWALKPPGFLRQWHLGVRVISNKKLVGFISAIPANLRIYEKVVHLVEINFLCVHKKLRAKRMAPLLIKEITRLVHLTNTWQAVYTAGRLLPRPISISKYVNEFHPFLKSF